ncbi:MAG: hypothetical protein ICV73_27660, partial [Acetobacteraceae bacterium]|nr:hypothetical protein [Acetobacteraceae bacterium]
ADRADEWNARYGSMLRALGDAGLPRDVPGTPWRSPAAAAALHLARSGDAASAWRAAGYPDENKNQRERDAAFLRSGGKKMRSVLAALRTLAQHFGEDAPISAYALGSALEKMRGDGVVVVSTEPARRPHR